MRLASNSLLLLAVALPTLANDFDECKVGARSCYGAAPQECKRENFIAPAVWVFAEEYSGDGACRRPTENVIGQTSELPGTVD
ncbi:hypothetical protein AA0113_g4411 [Alternaria arborescens]|uniref:Uncharacterized protein n=1 Tax=Alternaria arborescens TaxID=156630 RepID=A0A4Q4SAY8_9PLEO|nr:hypothetical protein AA0113_g4411 [Alternaria arborescens]